MRSRVEVTRGPDHVGPLNLASVGGNREIQRHCYISTVKDGSGFDQHSVENSMAGFCIEFEVELVGMRFRHEKKRGSKDDSKVLGLSTGRVEFLLTMVVGRTDFHGKGQEFRLCTLNL